jgi:hypothetical protein
LESITPPSQGGRIDQSWRFQVKENDECTMRVNQDYSFRPFYSILLHGLSSETPPLDYHQILDTGVTDATGDEGISHFNGMESFGNPDPDLGLYPFTNVVVTWDFHHTRMILPKKE